MVGSAAAAVHRHEESKSDALRQATEQLLEENTACFELEAQPRVTNSETEVVNGKPKQFIEIPLRDASVHNGAKYKDIFDTRLTDRLTQVLSSEFSAEYSVYGGERLDSPLIGSIDEEPGTKPETTDFNLQLDVLRTDTDPGERVANIYYSAAAFEFEDDQYREFVGKRLCGTVGFTVEVGGAISDLRLVDNQDAGQLAIREVVDQGSSHRN